MYRYIVKNDKPILITDTDEDGEFSENLWFLELKFFLNPMKNDAPLTRALYPICKNPEQDDDSFETIREVRHKEGSLVTYKQYHLISEDCKLKPFAENADERYFTPYLYIGFKSGIILRGEPKKTDIASFTTVFVRNIKTQYLNFAGTVLSQAEEPINNGFIREIHGPKIVT